MISVSTQFESGIYGTSRRTRGKVIFNILDVDATDNITSAIATSEASLSQVTQTVNTVLNPSAKYATLENDFWKADGTFALPPEFADKANYETGWKSDDICASGGTFASTQTLTIVSSADINSAGLTIFFDKKANEYADSFTIEAFTSASVSVDSVSVTGNSGSDYRWDTTLSNYRTVILAISKWATGNRRARVSEVAFGLVEEYDGDDIVNMNVVEDVDPIAKEASTNELRFTILDPDKRYNILNPSGVYSYLERRQKIQPYIGLDITVDNTEYIQMGEFYLTDWRSNFEALTATFTSRDILDILAQSTYRKGKLQTQNLKQLAEDILDDAGITEYNISTALASITSSGNIPIMSHRDALQMIAIAGSAVLYSSRTGTVVMETLSTASSGDTISFDNSYSSPQIDLAKLINTIDVNIHNYNAKTVSEEVYKGTVNLSGTSSVWIEYKEFPCQTVSVTVSAGTVNTETYYGNSALLNITHTGDVTITATGTILEISKTLYELESDTKPADEESLIATIDNTLITDTTLASNVASYVLSEYEKRFLYQCNWRGNPALEAKDIVVIEDDFSEDKEARLTRNEFNWDGGLGCVSDAKGGGE